MQAPLAPIRPHRLEANGDVRIDDYYWLREKENPEVTAYLEAENQYTETLMGPAASLERELYDEMLGRIKEDDADAPYPKATHLYYSRTEQGKPYSIYCRKKNANAPEEIILDGNQLADGHSYFALGNLAASPDEQLLAYSTNTDGDETYTLRVKDLRTGEMWPDAIPNTYYSFAWASDNRTFFYVTLDDAKRPFRVWRHQLGTAQDTLVYEEADERFEVQVHASRAHDYIFIASESKITSEVRSLRANDPQGTFALVWPRRDNVLYEVESRGDNFYVRTNDGAIDFKLVDQANQEVLPPRLGVFLEHVLAFRDYLVAFERFEGLPRILVRELTTGAEHYVRFEEAAFTLEPDVNAVFETNILRFRYSSLVTPSSVYDYNMQSRTRELKKQQPVLGGYDPTQYQTRRLLIAARDGAHVPVSLVARKDTPQDGKAPLLLYGYGSYGITIDPSFNSQRLSLLDRGVTYAIAHVRGGADLGRDWYEAGKKLHKKNTFFDFVDVAQALVDQGYSSPDRLAIQGGSAGGLLMGAAINLRPDLFRAAIAQVPFVDTLTTSLDPTLPLTIGEYDEWGNAHEPEVYTYMKSYSPYDNIEHKAYPHLLLTGGLNDPRVSYWEPAKFAAKIRRCRTDDGLTLLKTNMTAGHGGASGRYGRLKETAFNYAFVLMRITRWSPPA